MGGDIRKLFTCCWLTRWLWRWWLNVGL